MDSMVAESRSWPYLHAALLVVPTRVQAFSGWIGTDLSVPRNQSECKEGRGDFDSLLPNSTTKFSERHQTQCCLLPANVQYSSTYTSTRDTCTRTGILSLYHNVNKTWESIQTDRPVALRWHSTGNKKKRIKRPVALAGLCRLLCPYTGT